MVTAGGSSMFAESTSVRLVAGACINRRGAVFQPFYPLTTKELGWPHAEVASAGSKDRTILLQGSR